MISTNNPLKESQICTSYKNNENHDDLMHHMISKNDRAFERVCAGRVSSKRQGAQHFHVRMGRMPFAE